MEKNYFVELNSINVNDKTEKKGNLTYLSWAWSWGEVKKLHPDATYTIYENANGWNYHTDGKTCWVKTGVTINGIEHIEYLPVMDFKNRSILAEAVSSFDVNKTIQRSLTKAVARHGLGLYIYAGEDLPEDEAPKEKAKDKLAPNVDSNSDENLRGEIFGLACQLGVSDEDIEKWCKIQEKKRYDDLDTTGLWNLRNYLQKRISEKNEKNGVKSDVSVSQQS